MQYVYFNFQMGPQKHWQVYVIELMQGHLGKQAIKGKAPLKHICLRTLIRKTHLSFPRS